MALFRDIEGRFYEIPKEILEQHEVKKAVIAEDFRNKPVVGVQIPGPEAQSPVTDMMGQTPGIVVNQFFGVNPGQMNCPAESLPSDIEMAHYGTTVDDPKK